MKFSHWPSLLPQIRVAESLYGERGIKLVGEWFDLQTNRISDPAFARLFSDHISLEGTSSSDYNHRLVKYQGSSLLGGIRFFDSDPARPFVEVIAHNFPNAEALQSCVQAEWLCFKPNCYRILTAPETVLSNGAYLVMHIHAARYENMAKPDNRVSLEQFENPQDAIALVHNRYNDLKRSNPELASNVTPEHPDDLRTWHGTNQLKAIKAIHAGISTTVGVLAITPGSIEWIEGDVVQEEVIITKYTGHNFATSAQCTWASRNNIDRTRLLIGTIDRLNTASHRTAIKSGRKAVLSYIFIPVS